MLQQVSHPAPSAPHDRSHVAADAPAGADGARRGALDFLALLAQAEGQDAASPSAAPGPSGIAAGDEGVALAGDGQAGLVPGLPAPAGLGEPAQVVGQEAADASGGIAPGAEVAAEDGLPAGLLPGEQPVASPMVAMAVRPAAESKPPALSSAAASPLAEGASPDLPLASSVVAIPSRAAGPPQGAGGPAKVSPPNEAAGAEAMAAAQAVLGEPDGAGQAMPQDAFQDAPLDLPENAAPAFAARSDSPAPAPMSSALAMEGRGLSMPLDPTFAGAGPLAGQAGSGASAPLSSAGSALPYQRILYPQLSAQLAPAVLTMGLLPGAEGGPGRLTVAIRPAELGVLHIITERTEDGAARVAVLAERPETLQLLVRDAPTLETALRAAGVDEGGGMSLTFGLASQGQDGRGEDGRGEGPRAGAGEDGTGARTPLVAVAPAIARTSLLDLSL